MPGGAHSCSTGNDKSRRFNRCLVLLHQSRFGPTPASSSADRSNRRHPRGDGSNTHIRR
jgi:hypothetical protein